MYNYVITHVTDSEAFITELEELAPSYIYKKEDETKGWTIQHTPLVKNENGSLALSALTDGELAFINSMTTIKSLGTYEDLFANPESLATYKSVYPYDVPIEYVDDEGKTRTYMRPEKIGVFA